MRYTKKQLNQISETLSKLYLSHGVKVETLWTCGVRIDADHGIVRSIIASCTEELTNSEQHGRCSNFSFDRFFLPGDKPIGFGLTLRFACVTFSTRIPFRCTIFRKAAFSCFKGLFVSFGVQNSILISHTTMMNSESR